MENTDFAEICKSTSLENLKGFWNGVEYTEEWKGVKDYEGLYQVSSFGRVKSLERYSTGKHRYFMKEKVMKLTINTAGYFHIAFCKDSIYFSFRVHQLVAICFLGHIRDGFKYVVDHINNNPLNNFYLNLQIIKPRLNVTKDRVRKSRFVGVCFHNGKWQSTILNKGKQIFIGRFDNEEEAGLRYEEALENINNGIEVKVYRRCFTSKVRGIYFDKTKNKWTSRVTKNSKQINLGSFKTEDEAIEILNNYKKENGLL